ncbi:MAG: TSUP family transporter [Candidatus Brocadiae bacterium]|nr:TSUP family transporter [Candidatus Brocadiia bacterium]
MPDLDLTRTGICCAVAFAAGLIDAMAGGGGILTIPTIELAFRPSIPEVLGTNKFVGTSGSSTATVRFLLRGKMDRLVAWLGGGMAGIGAVFGAVAVASLGKIDDRITRPVFGVLLILMALYMFFKPQFGGENAWAGPTPRNLAILVSGGLLIGFYDGFFGPGTGSFLVFVMVRFLRFDFVVGTGNAKAMNFASNITSLATFIWKGLVIWPVAIPMGVANALGSWVGSSIAIAQGARFVRWVFLLAAVAIAVRMVVGVVLGH